MGVEKLVRKRDRPLPPILEFLRNRGVELFGSGEELATSSCPIGTHNKPGHRPVSVNSAKGEWYCNDHKVGGSVVKWVMLEKGCDSIEAKRSLNGLNASADRRIVCTYDYTDENGSLLYQSVRYEPKDFRQRRPDGNGDWIWSTKGIAKVLYHLPQVIASEIVLVTEGEKDADNLTALGFVTTTNVGGAGKWDIKYAQTLKGKNVVVFGDIDKPDEHGHLKGQEHTETVVRSLLGKARSLKHPIQPKGFHDISDYVATLRQTHPGEERQVIQQLIDRTPILSGPVGSERFEFEDLMAFDARHDPNCLVGNRYLVRGGSSLWAAGSGYGKSTLALQLAVYWACGQSCFGLRPVRPLKSLLIQAENDLGDMGEQLQGVMAGISSLGDIDVQASRTLIEKNVLIYRTIGKTGDDFLTILDVLLEIDKPDLAWVDPMFAFAGCDLLDPKETSRFLRVGLFPMAHRRRVAMNVIHHVGKPVRAENKTGTQISDIDLQYLGFGTSEIQNAFRVVNVLIPVSGDPGLFKLALSKRGERSGAGRSIYLRHSTEGMICWMQADAPEKPTKQRVLKYTMDTILGQMANELWKAKALQELVSAETGMSEKTFYRLWDDCKNQEKVRVNCDREWTKN